MMDKDKRLDLHLVSDSTGETVRSVARACLVQFEGVGVEEHHWPTARTARALEIVLDGIDSAPGAVLYTIVDAELRRQLIDGCRRRQVPCISVLDPVIVALGSLLGVRANGRPGRQYEMDDAYFKRIEATDWALSHDDGQATHTLDKSEVVLVGVSRTSKTPTSLYLANQGILAANVPYVPGCPLPPQLHDLSGPLVVALTKSPDRLVEVRRNRLLSLRHEAETAYVDPEEVRAELAEARRLFSRNGWPVLDVTRRSIEETAAAVMQLLKAHRTASADEPADDIHATNA